ncbi:hypothetical protein KAU09_01275 [Candidatus Parcubacteria bacterium]|nr:hypothetical protein [Candidatus Parcubacteria bacterium]
MKKLSLFGLLVIIFLAMLAGCAKYSEGDSVAEETWGKMTVTEKLFYDKVESGWKEDFEDVKLQDIRSAVRLRKIKPSEDAVPFIDMAKAIVLNNDVSLQLSGNEGSAHKKRKLDTRWDAIDHDWYRLILKVANKSKEDSETNQDEQSEEFNEKGNSRVALALNNYTEKAEEKNNSDVLLPADEYMILKGKIRNCPEAQELLEKIVSANQALTLADRNVLVEKYLICKTRNLLVETAD